MIGFADALAAPEAAASLLGAGHRVASFARRGRPVALRRLRGVELVEVTAPEDDLEACMGEVQATAARYDVTMPLDDMALFVCDRALPPSARVAGPRGAQARMALDKRVQLRAAAAAGFAVPAWVELDADGGLPEGWMAEGWTAPVVLKPALAAEEVDGRLRRLAPRLPASRERLEAVRREWGPTTPAFVQRWVAGASGGGLFGLAAGGTLDRLSAHRRVRMMNPAGSGSSACASAPVPAELVPALERLMAGLGWEGMFMVEILDVAGESWFMELNGRPWGSLALTRRLGYEYPAWAVALALDGACTLPPAPAFSELTCRHLGRELVHLLFVLRGPGTHAGDWPGRGETLRALLRGGVRTARGGEGAGRGEGGTTWYNLAPGMTGLFIEDTLRTIAEQTFGRWRR